MIHFELHHISYVKYTFHERERETETDQDCSFDEYSSYSGYVNEWPVSDEIDSIFDFGWRYSESSASPHRLIYAMNLL